MQVALIGMPISMGIAILRYRLYEIDLIINRTLVYGPLTATLVALYFVGIVVLQRVFVLLTGQQATLAVVASTLLIAALFTPPWLSQERLQRHACPKYCIVCTGRLLWPNCCDR